MPKPIEAIREKLEVPLQVTKTLTHSFYKQSKQYLYIENVLVPANFYIRYSESGRLQNVGTATLSANIQPAMLRDAGLKENDMAQLMAILKLSPIVVATELIYEADTLPNEKTVQSYDRQEVVRFIGVVDGSQVSLDYGSGQLSIGFTAVDLLNYLLENSSLYLFGESGAVSGIQASSSMAYPIIQEILAPILQGDNNYGKVLGGLLSLIGLKRRTIITDEKLEKIRKNLEESEDSQKEGNEPEIQINDEQLHLLKIVKTYSHDTSSLIRVLQNAAKNGQDFIGNLLDRDFVYKLVTETSLTSQQVYDILNHFLFPDKANTVNSPLIPCDGPSCDPKTQTQEYHTEITDTQVIYDKLFNAAMRTFFFEGDKMSFYTPKASAVIYSYWVQDYKDYRKNLLQSFRDFIDSIFRTNVSIYAGALDGKRSAPRKQLYKRAEKVLNEFGDLSRALPDEKFKEIDNDIYIQIKSQFAQIDKEREEQGLAPLPPLEKVILAILAQENSIDVPLNYAGAGTSAQVLYHDFFHAPHANQTLEEIFGKIQAEFLSEIDAEFITAVQNAPDVFWYGVPPYGEHAVTQAIYFLADYKSSWTGGDVDGRLPKECYNPPSIGDWQSALKGEDAALNKIRKFTQCRLKYKKDSVSDKEIYIENIYAALYSKMNPRKRREIDYALASAALLENLYVIMNACPKREYTIEDLAAAYFSGGNACKKEVWEKYGIDEYATNASALYDLFARGLTDLQIDLADVSMDTLKEIVSENENWSAFSEYALERLREKLGEMVPQTNALLALDEAYDIDEPKNKYYVDEYLFHASSRLRDFVLKSIIVPQNMSNWYIMATVLQQGLLSIKEKNVTIGHLVDLFLQLTKTKIVPIPPMMTRDESGKWRILLYAAIPNISYPPLPSQDNKIFKIEPISNRFYQDSAIGTAAFMDNPNKATTMYISMSIGGAPMLLTIPLAKILNLEKPVKNIEEFSQIVNSDYNYMKFYERVLNESPIEKITPPVFAFMQGTDPLMAALQTNNLWTGMSPDFSEFSWMFLSYLMFIPHYWAQWTASHVRYMTPVWNNSIVGFPFRLSTLVSGNFIGVLSSYETQATAHSAMTSYAVRSIFHMETHSALVPVLDPAYPADMVFVDVFFKASDYLAMKLVADMLDSAMSKSLTPDLKEMGITAVRLLYADTLMGPDITRERALLETLQPETRRELEALVRPGMMVRNLASIYNIRMPLRDKLRAIYQKSMEIGTAALYYNEQLRSIDKTQREAAARQESAIFEASVLQAYKGLLTQVNDKRLWIRANIGRYGPFSIQRVRAF